MSSLKVLSSLKRGIFLQPVLPALSVRNVSASSTLPNEQSKTKVYDDKKIDLTRRRSEFIFCDEKSLIFDQDPDSFGTLTSNSTVRQIMEEIKEEGDEDKVEYIDGIEGKIWRKPVHYAMMIKELLRERKLVEALNILEIKMLKEERGKPDVYIYNLLITACAKEGYTKKAFQLFNQMKKRGLRPKQSTYTSLFNACAEGPFATDSLNRARNLRELMLEKGIEPNLANYHAMIKAFGRHGDLETSFAIVDEMSSKQIPLTSVTFNFLLQASASDKEAGFRHALIVWRKMLEKKVVPTVFTFNLLLRCVRDCGAGDVASAQELVSLITSNQLLVGPGNDAISDGLSSAVEAPPNLLLPAVQPTSITVTSALEKASDRFLLLGNTEGLFNTMDLFKAAPDIKTFTQLLDILPPSSELEEKLVSEMGRRKITVDIDFCNMLIKKRNFTQRSQEALEVLNLIKKEKLIPNIMTFGVLALGCKSLESTKQLINDIEEIGYRVNIEILGALMKCAYEMLDIDMALYIIDNMQKEEVRPSPNFIFKAISLKKSLEFNMELKEQRKEYLEIIDAPGFQQKFISLRNKIRKLKGKVEDPSAVHPWEQFKQKTETVHAVNVV